MTEAEGFAAAPRTGKASTPADDKAAAPDLLPIAQSWRLAACDIAVAVMWRFPPHPDEFLRRIFLVEADNF